jgi:predicted regulator of Ras-like GTPase activity (Roadblock/LC7/MglB family)
MIVEPPRGDLKSQLEELLEQARRSTHCQSIALARRDGLVIVHRLQAGIDPRLAAAMAAATVGAATSTAAELRKGKVHRVIVECDEGTIIAMDAGHDALVLGLFDKQANLGLAIHGLGRMARSIAEILTGW